MKKAYSILFFILFLTVYAADAQDVLKEDTNKVILLNKSGYDSRLTKPSESIVYANRALALAQKLKYINGQAEAYRIKGIGEYYLNQSDKAISDYMQAKDYYEQANNQNGIAKVYNNIGNLYQEVDYDEALRNFYAAEKIANKTHNDQLIASLNLNIGNVYFRKNNFTKALDFCLLSQQQFTKLGNTVFLVQCLQDLGAIYFHLNDIDKAEEILLEANKKAKKQDLYLTVASLNLKLIDIYIKKNKLAEAEKYLEEGKNFAELIKNDKYINDYRLTAYDLEVKRKNYKKALSYFLDIYKQDSIIYHSGNRAQMSLVTGKLELDQVQKDQDISRLRFWLVTIVATLLMAVVALLMSNVKRKAITNTKLQELNDEISRQKDNLDRINHHLEEIIDERTKDLQVKNKKLSEYSSYLSHQIRGPIATLKGLMNLEKEKLIDKEECINMMDKCVSEIDDKIIKMSNMLHDHDKAGF